MEPTLYDVLGVSRDAGPERIRAAWRQVAEEVEPGEGSAQRYRRVNEAAEVLLDPERRTAYDATLDAELGPARQEAPDVGPASPAAGSPEETAGVSAAPTGRGTVQRRSVALVASLAALALAAVVLGAFFGAQGWHSYQDERRAERFQEALDRAPAAAENAAAAVLSYDHRSLEADRDAAAQFLTEDYRAEYVDTFNELVVQSAKQTKATVEAEVLASAPMSSPRDRPDRVPVLVFVNQTTTSSASADPRVALNRVQLDMVQVDGTWLVDGITSY